MKLCVFSDPHGELPAINGHHDVVCCCGDFSPLRYQSSFGLMTDWIDYDFSTWLKELDCDRFILIAGNHDLCCERKEFKESFKTIMELQGLSEKVVYLENESYEYCGKKFFGCPYSDIPGWAFSVCNADPETGGYNKIEPNVDVLLVHQAPDYNDVGTSDYDQHCPSNFGSKQLTDVIYAKKPKYVFCGHIHSGNHEKTVFNESIIYNTSIKNERYQMAYLPLTIEI